MNDDVTKPDDIDADDVSMAIRQEGTIKKIVVDREGCIGARSCVVIAEKLFQMDDENLAYITHDVNSTDDETLKLAAEACPVLAIHLYGENDTKIFPKE